MNPQFKIVLGGSFGSLLEWYDYTLYGFMAPIFGKLFFPGIDPLAQLLATFGTFAIAYLGRPFGSFIFGHWADKIGRKPILIFSIALMGLMTTALGFLPTYAQVGIWAPMGLLAVRVLQGLSVGGEYMDSAIFLAEHAPPGQRGRYAGSINVLSGCGVLIAACVATFVTSSLSESDLLEWGWRTPFYIGIVAASVGVLFRLGLKESPIYRSLKKRGEIPKSPIGETFRLQRMEMTTCFCMVCLQTVSFYVPTVFLNAWAVRYEHLELGNALRATSIALVVLILATYMGSHLSDRLGRRPVLLTVALLYFILAYPLFWVLTLETIDSLARFLVVQCILTALAGCYNGALPATLVEIFSARTRCTAMSVSYNLAAGIVGGLTPFLCTLVIDLTHIPTSPALYMMLAAAVAGSLIFFRVRETAFKALRH